MQKVMFWLGVGYSVLTGVSGICATLARAFPNVPFFSAAAGAVGTLALDIHRLLGGE